jgi:hypothetical protein
MANWAESVLWVVLFFGVWAIAWGAIAFPLIRKYEWRPFKPTAPSTKLILLLPLYLIAPFVIWGSNSILNQSWNVIGVFGDFSSVRSLVVGFVIAATGLFLLLLFKKNIGLITIDSSPQTDEQSPKLGQQFLAIVGLLLLAIWIGGIEELVFRGWLQTQLEIALIPWVAAMISSLIFAVAHLIWDGRAGLWQQPGLFLLGWVLVVARWASGGSIALAWGLHAGWVWGLACVGELIKPDPVSDKPIWLTGRAAQPLTDVLDIALMLITAGLVWRFSSSLI